MLQNSRAVCCCCFGSFLFSFLRGEREEEADKMSALRASQRRKRKRKGKKRKEKRKRKEGETPLHSLYLWGPTLVLVVFVWCGEEGKPVVISSAFTTWIWCWRSRFTC